MSTTRRATGRPPGTSGTPCRPGTGPGTPSRTWGNRAGPPPDTTHGVVRSQPDRQYRTFHLLSGADRSCTPYSWPICRLTAVLCPARMLLSRPGILGPGEGLYVRCAYGS
jgi:hypothetical protein